MYVKKSHFLPSPKFLDMVLNIYARLAIGAVAAIVSFYGVPLLVSRVSGNAEVMIEESQSVQQGGVEKIHLRAQEGF